jgi:ABC-2 type transport system ATP-binding protein
LEIRKRCGYLPGNFDAYGNLTGMEFLQLCARLRGMRFGMDNKFPGRFDLTPSLLNKKIKYLSHGTHQKLGIVQAFFHHPDLLILDEPTIGLDPLMQEEFYHLLKEHHSNGATIFLSSHNLTEVERICSRMAIIRRGILEKTDTIINLRKLLRKRLQITLSAPQENMKLTAAELIKQDGMHYEFFINGDIRTLLKELSELPLVDISLPEPGLDEIFINFYKEEINDKPGIHKTGMEE